MSGANIRTQLKHEEEYKDCPYEMYGKEDIKEIKTDVKNITLHIQGMEIERAGDSQKLINVEQGMNRVEQNLATVQQMIVAQQQKPQPVDTFKAVIYDLGLWVFKVALLGGGLLYIADKLKIG